MEDKYLDTCQETALESVIEGPNCELEWEGGGIICVAGEEGRGEGAKVRNECEARLTPSQRGSSETWPLAPNS